MNDKSASFTYVSNASTDICLEVASDINPFLTEKQYLAGFDIEALTAKSGFIDTLYLLFKQELPSRQSSRLLNALFVALINAGPRDEAVRASMTAGISKTRPEHLLPIGLTVIGGENNGAQTVEKAYNFIENHVTNLKGADIENKNLLSEEIKEQLSGFSGNDFIDSQWCLLNIPGFSQSFGSIDALTARLMDTIFSIEPTSQVFTWCKTFHEELSHYNLGISPIGLAAAVFLQLKFGARESIGLYQLLRAPGILAHGMEQTHKPITDAPMLKDESYDLVIKRFENEQ